MLDELNNVNWENLEAAHCPATEVPRLIRQLTSDDLNTRMEAFERLFEQLWHQENIFEASLYALPHLVELLKAPGTPDKSRIAELVAAIATGTPPYHWVKDDGADWNAILREEGKSLEEELAKERIVIEGVREEVKRALPVLRPYLRDPYSEPIVRKLVAEVLTKYPEYVDEHVRLLQDVLRTETDNHTREIIQQSIDVLRRPAGDG